MSRLNSCSSNCSKVSYKCTRYSKVSRFHPFYCTGFSLFDLEHKILYFVQWFSRARFKKYPLIFSIAQFKSIYSNIYILCANRKSLPNTLRSRSYSARESVFFFCCLCLKSFLYLEKLPINIFDCFHIFLKNVLSLL